MTVFETDRLVVRRLRPDDLDDFAALCGDPAVVRYMDDGRPLSREQTQQWIDVSLANYRERGWGCFGVAAKPGDRLIGFAGFARPPERPGVVELIYAFAPDRWGRGYATEVAAAMVAFGFDRGGLTRIEATVDPANDASKRVLTKIGMAYQGRQANDDGTFTDYYAIERGSLPPEAGPADRSHSLAPDEEFHP
jgi:ribosomal-protein-alanine N-acetyltransferase